MVQCFRGGGAVTLQVWWHCLHVYDYIACLPCAWESKTSPDLHFSPPLPTWELSVEVLLPRTGTWQVPGAREAGKMRPRVVKVGPSRSWAFTWNWAWSLSIPKNLFSKKVEEEMGIAQLLVISLKHQHSDLMVFLAQCSTLELSSLAI